MFEKILDFIRSRTQEEWYELVLDQWRDARIWLQENGELAFFAGMVLCFLVITFFKAFAALIAVGALCAIVTYHLALSESEIELEEGGDDDVSDVSEEVEVSRQAANEPDDENGESPLTH